MFSQLFTASNGSGEPRQPASMADIADCTPKQRRLALTICTVMIVGTLALLPFARVQWPYVPFFFPLYQTVVIISCLLTAYLMYGHSKATRSVGLLRLSAGYLYTAGVLAMQCVSQHGAFLQNDQLLGGTQTSIWLWFFWHLGPALSVLYFA